MWSDKAEEYFDIREKVLNSEAFRVSELLRKLRISQCVVMKNCDELVNGIVHFESDYSLWNLENREKRDKAHEELIRVLHNCLASKESFVEHTRRFISGLGNSTLIFEAESQGAQFNGLTNLLTALRHEVLHHRLIYPTARHSMSRVSDDSNLFEVETKIILKKTELIKVIESSKLKKSSEDDAKKYLAVKNENIHLKEVIEEYQKLIQNYYSWLYKRVQELYNNEFEKLQLLLPKLKELESESN